MDLGRAGVVELPPEETQRRWDATTPQWPIMHAVTYGVTRDQMMARHKANHIQVAYANSAEEADRALLAKAAMADALGMEVAVCAGRKRTAAGGDEGHGDRPVMDRRRWNPPRRRNVWGGHRPPLSAPHRRQHRRAVPALPNSGPLSRYAGGSERNERLPASGLGWGVGESAECRKRNAE